MKGMGWSLVDSPVCGCKGINFVMGWKIGRRYYLECCNCLAAWEVDVVYVNKR